MDPSCTFAFFLQTRADLEELVELSESMGKHKIFELLDGTKDEYLAIVTDPSIRVRRVSPNLSFYISISGCPEQQYNCLLKVLVISY